MDDHIKTVDIPENSRMNIPIMVDVMLYLSLLVVRFPVFSPSSFRWNAPQLGCGALRHVGWALSIRWQSYALGGAEKPAEWEPQGS